MFCFRESVNFFYAWRLHSGAYQKITMRTPMNAAYEDTDKAKRVQY